MNNQSLNNQIILILKDSQKDLSTLLDALQLAHYIILVVQNKQDYVSVIKSIQPSSIVLDFMMSDVDIWKVCQKLKSNLEIANIPLVFINSSEDVAKKIAELGRQNVDCVSQSSEPEKTVCLIRNRLLSKQHSPINSSIATATKLKQNTKLVNHQLQTTPNPLLSVNQDIDDFASMVSHDLQSSLRSLTMFAELLTSEYQDDLDIKGQEYLARISNSGSRMQALIENLRAYSHAGKSEQTWIAVNLKEVCHQVEENLQFAIAQSQAQITVGDLPEILINPTEISQVIQNLLENAIKFNQNTPHIEVNATQQEREWLISIRDNGIGIAEEFQSKIFQAFHRLYSTGVYPGTGIGLALCQKIIERYGGNMGVESTPGEG
ncbi:MAG: ATP-binding protein, partial [Pleurocapsa sp.]